MYKLTEICSLDDLKEQYLRQAEWSAEVLDHFWPKKMPGLVLDVGCGPAPDYLLKKSAMERVGVDIDNKALGRIHESINRVQANSIALPFSDNTFDVVLCHYLLLWTPMRETLHEMWRVTVPGGRVICASEPDYYNRKESPHGIKDEFIAALESLGAHPGAGGKLEQEMAQLTNKYESGVLTQIENKEFQLAELRSDVEFISRILGKDISEKAQPLVNSLKNSSGDIYMPVHFGCAIKSE